MKRVLVNTNKNKKSLKNKKCVHSYGIPAPKKIFKKIEYGMCREKNGKK